MADDQGPQDNVIEQLAELIRTQNAGLTGLFGLEPAAAEHESPDSAGTVPWAAIAQQLQSMWGDYRSQQAAQPSEQLKHFTDPVQWLATAESIFRQLPLGDPGTQARLLAEGLSLAETVLGRFGIGENASPDIEFPRKDRRFADPLWRDQPIFALLHQAYLMVSEQLVDMAENAAGLEADKRAKLSFATRTLVDALSPSNFLLTNPVALEKARETKGESLIKGMENLLADLKRGQLTHTSPAAFKLGENIAATPGKIIHETPLYQVIQYAPVTDRVLKSPLVIFPPWINRFYILDLNPEKSFVRWAVEQGVSVFMLSWKSADESMGDVVWDDYIAAQIDVVDLVRERLNVPSVHTIGYCVAGTTLAASLAVMARKGLAGRVKSATFFTAQVDFSQAGDLEHFIDDQQIESIGVLSRNGCVDGRYLSATFNLMRGNELIWNYVERNYLKGEDYPAFDLLHWNSDYTNLPARWHQDYLRDLYRDNRLVITDSLRACGEPIDLSQIETPCFIQAGREDHIAPPQSVWKLTQHISGEWTFLLAGSGHIAGVINPPISGKYQYWTNDGSPASLDEFVQGSSEHPGSWWPYWLDWLRSRDSAEIAVRGRRKPGGRGDDAVIEDAPGRYVTIR